ncbi:hypothetical protein ATZ36_04980 [Candidatus Endomicrobiellum trichonymphae]|uniref:Uncharacterized protein n=1 Tax=Endomicrobium trichonymphae TaxID=1408204 RepID=A0A1E5IIG8_ENDTX|nr:hypothetical protein ATZ36_04980 [Candidatus Endomicrobium trichonymphae]
MLKKEEMKKTFIIYSLFIASPPPDKMTVKKIISVYIIFAFLLTSFTGCGKLKNSPVSGLNQSEVSNSSEIVNQSETSNSSEIVNQSETSNSSEIVNQSETSNSSEIVNQSETSNSSEIVNQSETSNSSEIVNQSETSNEINISELLAENNKLKIDYAEREKIINRICFGGVLVAIAIFSSCMWCGIGAYYEDRLLNYVINVNRGFEYFSFGGQESSGEACNFYTGVLSEIYSYWKIADKQNRLCAKSNFDKIVFLFSRDVRVQNYDRAVQLGVYNNFDFTVPPISVFRHILSNTLSTWTKYTGLSALSPEREREIIINI